jgi:two-component system sensor kinase FixL
MLLGTVGPPDAGTVSSSAGRRAFTQTTAAPHRAGFLEGSIVFAQAVLIVGLVLERRRQRGVERSLQQQRDFEILISELSSSITMLGATERSAFLARWVQRLAICLDVDRVSLLPAANGHHGGMPLALGAPWGSASVYPTSDFPALTNLVMRGDVVRFASLDVLPPELATDRPAFRRHGVEAAVLVPLRHNGAVLGALALGASTARHWPVTLVERLEFVGATLASTVSVTSHENGASASPGNGNGGNGGAKSAAVAFDPRRENEIARFARVRTLGGFALSLAHELNQPLSAILANAQAARRFLASPNPPIDEVRAIIDDIDADDRRAGELIHAMRALLHNHEIEMVLLDPNDVLRDVARLLHGDLLFRRVTLVLDLEAPLPKVRCDLVQLQQVLLNLLMNAFEAMVNTATVDRRVIIRTRAGNESCVISVRDAGDGIAPEKFEHLFEQFFSTKSDGLGMGLSISRSIIEGHGGRIWATNNSDAGATFHVALPIALGKEQS